MQNLSMLKISEQAADLIACVDDAIRNGNHAFPHNGHELLEREVHIGSESYVKAIAAAEGLLEIGDAQAFALESQHIARSNNELLQ